jgi:hypothetical protein
MEETQVQFVNFTVTYTFIGDAVGGACDYEQTVDLDNNSARINLTNILITKSEVPSGDPQAVYANNFVFTFTGFYGEEVADRDFYRARVGDDIIQYRSFNDLPDFSQPKVYLIDFLPDPREESNIQHRFSTNTGIAQTKSVTVTLNQSRHLTRIQAIRNTLEQRANEEKLSIIRDVESLAQLYPEEE